MVGGNVKVGGNIENDGVIKGNDVNFEIDGHLKQNENGSFIINEKTLAEVATKIIEAIGRCAVVVGKARDHIGRKLNISDKEEL